MKKRTLIFSSVAIFSVLFLFGIYLHFKDAVLFEKTAKEIFQSELSGDTLSMHYTLAHPEDWNLKNYQVSLKPYSEQTRQETADELQDYLEVLARVNGSNLNGNTQYDYQIIYNYMKMEQKAQEFFYFNEPLSPNSGMQSQLPILLAEYTFRSKQDVDDYLSILEQSPDYFNGLAVFESEKANQGLLMPDESLQSVINQCDVIMNSAELESGTHFLHTTFEERLIPLVEKKLITADEAKLYLSENDRLLTTVLKPAYDQLADSLCLLLGSCKNKEGLAHFPNGQEYYLLLLQKNTCTDRDIVTIKNMLKSNLEATYQKLAELVSSNREFLPYFSQNAPQDGAAEVTAFPLNAPEDMLEQLKDKMAQDFPVFPVTDAKPPAYTVKTISESLQPYSSPAFYLTPPIDDISENTIYINPKNDASGLSLYTTLAHEGYPGHLFQTVYSTLHQSNQGSAPLRHLLYFGGYIEGWALYTEMLSYDYAKGLLEPSDKATLFLYDLEKLEEELQLCLYSILDISIHYDGISLEKATTLLQQFGIDNPAGCKAIYEYIRDEPTNYLKYYLGYLEFQELKALAKTVWGSDYSNLRFHTFVLEKGPCDFNTLRTHLMKPEEISVK